MNDKARDNFLRELRKAQKTISKRNAQIKRLKADYNRVINSLSTDQLNKIFNKKEMLSETKPTIVIGRETVHRLENAETIELENAILIPDDYYFNLKKQ